MSAKQKFKSKLQNSRGAFKQLALMKSPSLAYGGSLMTTRKGRAGGGRPLDTKGSLHLVLRSTRAVGEWSFRQPAHAEKIEIIVNKFALKYSIEILAWANVGNHLHFHLCIVRREGYAKFIRAITGAIAMAVKGSPRWNKNSSEGPFWDRRPFTRVLRSRREELNLQDYIEVNQWEGLGVRRFQARVLVARSERMRK